MILRPQRPERHYLNPRVAISAQLAVRWCVVPESELMPEIRKSGHRMADLAVAFSALFVSLCSLGIALHHGRTMQRLVEANSRPFIQFGISHAEHGTAESPSHALTVMISNPGAGAARIERFSILVDGKPTNGMADALMRLSGSSSAASLGQFVDADIAPSYLKAGSEEEVLRWPRTEANAALWDKVVAAGENRVKYEACYCSIFDECWIENSDAFKPAPTKSCA
jgi:hypothetical protein